MLELTPLSKLTKDIRTAAATLSDEEARFLVNAYYTMQDNRIRSRGQERSLAKQEKPHEIISFFADQDELLEGQIKKALESYTMAHPMGSWMREIHGIGPIIAAGMLALIDMDKAPTVGHIWAFAGYAADGQKPWEKGKIKPFSTQFRTLCWHAGQSFMKFHKHEECFYGHIYRERKDLETANNEKLLYKAQAEIKMNKVGKNTEAYGYYSQGKLPPAHIDARARRYAVKIFLSHLHQVWYQVKYGVPAPKPFAISHLNHAHMIEPPVPVSVTGGFSERQPPEHRVKSSAPKTNVQGQETPKKRGRPKKEPKT